MQIFRNHPAVYPLFPWNSPRKGCKIVSDYDPLKSPNPVLKDNFISCIAFKPKMVYGNGISKSLSASESKLCTKQSYQFSAS